MKAYNYNEDIDKWDNERDKSSKYEDYEDISVRDKGKSGVYKCEGEPIGRTPLHS